MHTAERSPKEVGVGPTTIRFRCQTPGCTVVSWEAPAGREAERIVLDRPADEQCAGCGKDGQT